MARYYFHVQDGRTILDDEGVELPDLDAARKEAIRASGEALRDGIDAGIWAGESWRMWVTAAPGGNGHTFFTLRFSASEI